MPSYTDGSPSSFSIVLKQSVLSLCITAWSHILLQKRLFSSASGITLFLCAPSNSLNNFFWFDSNNRFCLYCFVLLSYLSSFAPTATNLYRTSSLTTSAPFLFIVNFLSSFDMTTSFFNSPRLILILILIVLSLCVIPSASLKFFFANLVVCLLSSSCFWNPPSQQQHCQQCVMLSLFL